MDRLKNALAAVEKIDDQLISLLNQRYQETRIAAECLREQDMPLYDPACQRQIMERLLRGNQGPMTPEIVRAIYREIFSGVQQLEQPHKAAFLGPLPVIWRGAPGTQCRELPNCTSFICCQSNRAGVLAAAPSNWSSSSAELPAAAGYGLT